MLDAAARAGLFHFVMIKPTHYDDDGYPIRWVKAAIPSNTLAALNSLAEDAVRRHVLGPGVELRLQTFDETNQRVRPQRIIREIRRTGEGGSGMAAAGLALGWAGFAFLVFACLVFVLIIAVIARL